MRSKWLCLIAASALIAPAAAHGDVVPDLPPALTGHVGTDIGTFSAACGFSHRASDDPIVFPGMPGASHSHDFIGARTTNAFSTGASLRASATTCVRTNSPNPDSDRAAYWVPTLYVNDVAVAPSTTTVEYKTGRRLREPIRAFAPAFRLIAGSAAGGQQEVGGGLRIWFFECKDGTVKAGGGLLAPTCASTLVLTMRFPDCSNGELNSPDHKAHMAYSQQVAGTGPYVCPPSHPLPRPKLSLLIRYPTSAGPSTRLASGGLNTAHADFFNGWVPGIQEQLVTTCLNSDRYCGGGDVPD